MRWASSSRNFAAALAAFFFLALTPPAAQAESPQILPLDPHPLVVVSLGGPRSYFIEIADDASERAVGMMFRQSAPRDRGMLFDFGQSRMVTIWMRNTFAPLDIIFIGDDMRIVKISPDAVPLSEAHIGSGAPVRFALELAAGAAARAGLRVGDLVRHPVITSALSGGEAK